MRKLIYTINVTIDGCCDHTKMVPDEEVLGYGAQLVRDAGLLVYGRKTYQLMVPYWPDIAKSQSETKAEIEFAQTFVSKKKIVFSRSLASAEDENTRIVRTNLPDEILKLKEKQGTRRELLRNAAGFAGSALLAQLFPASLLSAGVRDLRQQAATAQTDSLAAMRAQMGSAPIQSQPVVENLTLLSGPGGNVVVLNGPDPKIVVDTFLMPAWPKLKETLDGLGNAPLKTVIDTHWHVDHTD